MTAPQRPLLGIALVVLATLTFSVADVLTKKLTLIHSVSVIVAVRYAVNLLAVTAVMAPRQKSDLWRMTRPGLVLLRGLCLAFASLTMAIALRWMPVGETVAIIYLAPFIVLLASGPLLGEKVNSSAWIGAAIGFAGVLLIMRPGSGLHPFGVTMALINVGFSTAYHLLTRLLSRTEKTSALLWHTAWIGTLFFGIGTFFDPTPVAISLGDFGMMAALGILAAAGHGLFTSAYREAPPALLAPVNYIHLVWAGLLGWVVFHHVPDPWAITGIGLVCVAGIWAAVMRGR